MSPPHVESVPERAEKRPGPDLFSDDLDGVVTTDDGEVRDV